MQPVFYLFAGINGAGKTSLYRVISEMVELGERVSIDERVKELGDWREPGVQRGRASIPCSRGCAVLRRGGPSIRRRRFPARCFCGS